MSSSAIINIIGNLGRDPEVRDAGGSKVCSFSVAVTDRVRGAEVTSWYNVSVWGRKGESSAEYLASGRQVNVSGRLTLRPYESNGEKRISADVNASEVTFLGSRSDGDSSGGNEWSKPATKPAPAQGGGWDAPAKTATDDPIPF